MNRDQHLDPLDHNDLHENDLARFLAEFGPWWKKYGNTITTVVLILLAVYVGKRWYDTSQAKAHEAAWSDLADATSPAACQAVANEHADPAVTALAYLRAGDLLLKKASELQLPNTATVGGESSQNTTTGQDQIGESDPQETSPSSESTNSAQTSATRHPRDPQLTPAAALETAATMYQRVTDDGSLPLLFRLNGHLGLAAVAEGLDDWDEAQRQYQSVLTQAGPGYEAMLSMAQTRLDLLEDIKSPVVFGPEPEAVPVNISDVLKSIENNTSNDDVDLPDDAVEAPAGATTSGGGSGDSIETNDNDAPGSPDPAQSD